MRESGGLTEIPICLAARYATVRFETKNCQETTAECESATSCPDVHGVPAMPVPIIRSSSKVLLVKPRHLKLLAVLLPLFIARSLLPIGFMVSFDAALPRLVFCPSQVTLPNPSGDTSHAMHVPQGHEHHHPHHHSGADETSNNAEQSHTSCPFAFAAAAPFAVANIFETDPPASEAIAASSASARFQLLSRAHPIRGPPVLS